MRIQHLSSIISVVALVATGTGAIAETVGGAPDASRPRVDTVAQLPQAGPRPTRPTDPAPHGLFLAGGPGDGNAAADAAVDAMLGVVPMGQAAQGAKHIYVDGNGDLACVTLDTFFPEAC